MSKYTATINQDEILSSIAYKELLNKKSAVDFYKDNGASDHILELVKMYARSYGCFGEEYATVIENVHELRNFIKKHRTKSWVLNE